MWGSQKLDGMVLYLLIFIIRFNCELNYQICLILFLRRSSYNLIYLFKSAVFIFSLFIKCEPIVWYLINDKLTMVSNKH